MDAERMLAGKLFHIRGPATAKFSVLSTVVSVDLWVAWVGKPRCWRPIRMGDSKKCERSSGLLSCCSHCQCCCSHISKLVFVTAC